MGVAMLRVWNHHENVRTPEEMLESKEVWEDAPPKARGNEVRGPSRSAIRITGTNFLASVQS